MGDWGDLSPKISKVGKKSSKINGIKLVGYTFRLKNYIKILRHFFRILQSWDPH